MQHEVGVAVVQEVLVQLGALLLAVDKHKHLALLLIVFTQQLQQALKALLLAVPYLNKLGDAWTHRAPPPGLHHTISQQAG
jgi:hypothetical protein